MKNTISYKDLDGWLKFLVVMGWVNMGLFAIGFLFTVFEYLYLM